MFKAVRLRAVGKGLLSVLLVASPACFLVPKVASRTQHRAGCGDGTSRRCLTQIGEMSTSSGAASGSRS